MAERAIYIMAKAPVAGGVKTRLCPPFTPQQAADLYAAFLADTIAQAHRVAADLFLMCPTQADADGLRDFANGVATVTQPAPGLTAGLIHVFRHAQEGGYRQAMALSSDNPTLPPTYLDAGFAALDTHAVSFGPSSDGGYYFVAATNVYETLFTDMRWSTDTVLAETHERARQTDLPVFLAPLWYDIDTVADLPRLLDEFEAAPTAQAGAHTRRLLDTLPLAALARQQGNTDD